MRDERAYPGELVHPDIKKLRRIGQLGHRIDGDRRRRARGVGFEYTHVAIDDHSRLIYAEVLHDERGATTAGFLERAVAYAQAYRHSRWRTGALSRYRSFYNTARPHGALSGQPPVARLLASL